MKTLTINSSYLLLLYNYQSILAKMSHKKLTNFLVFFFMLTGVALMAYGEIEKRDLENSMEVKTVCTKTKTVCTKSAG